MLDEYGDPIAIDIDGRAFRQCKDCGFLTLRNEYSGLLDEVDADFRTTGNPPRRRVPNRTMQSMDSEVTTPYRHVPICFAQEYNLLNDLWPSENPFWDKDIPGEMVKQIIDKERPCASYMRWRPGFTPKEHREMQDRQRQRDNERAAQKEAKDREDARDEQAKKWRSDDLKVIKSQHRWQLFWFGVAVVGATLLGSLIQADWIGKPGFLGDSAPAVSTSTPQVTPTP